MTVSVRSEKRPAMKALVRETVSNAILEAAEAVAAERGLEHTSTTAIAERAGVAVGTLYNYFPDRDALIAALFKLRRDQILPRLGLPPGAARAESVEQRLRAYVEQVLGVFEEHRAFCRIALVNDPVVARAKGRQSPVLPVMLDAVAEILRPIARDRSDDYARMLLGAMIGLVRLRLEQGRPLAVDADLVVDTFLHGITRA